MAAQLGQTARRFPTRTCVGCRTPREKRELIRIVRTPMGEIVLDRSGRHNGRGAYLCADGSCWRAAARSGALTRLLQTTRTDEVQAVLAAGLADLGPERSAETGRPSTTGSGRGTRG